MLDAVARSLCRVDHHDGRGIVDTPLLYPDGSSVAIQVDDTPDGCRISDGRAADEQARALGVDNAFRAQAIAIAQAAGIAFEDGAFVVIATAPDRVAGAIVTVANCAKEAVDRAVPGPAPPA
jgi:hypothetical protein